jgi:anti-sigma factor RsiW
MTDCIRFAPMIGARPGELGVAEAQALEAHLATCETCRAIAANFAALDGLAGESLLARASQRDFGPFVDQVMARLERRPRRAGLLAWLGVHRRAVAATLAPVLAALAVIVYVRSSGGAPGEIALVEITSEGEATTVLETADGPVVLLDGGGS